MTDKITVEFEFPKTEYEEEGLSHEEAVCRFVDDLQSLAYDRAGLDGAQPSRDALAGSFHIVTSERLSA